MFTAKEMVKIKKIVEDFPECEFSSNLDTDPGVNIMNPDVPVAFEFTFKLAQYKFGVLIDSIDRDVTITESAAFMHTGLLVECATLLLRANQLVKRLELVFEDSNDT